MQLKKNKIITIYCSIQIIDGFMKKWYLKKIYYYKFEMIISKY